MVDNEIKVESITFNFLIRKADLDNAIDIFSNMKSYGYESNLHTLNHLIRKTNSYLEAHKLFQSLKDETGFNEYSFHHLLAKVNSIEDFEELISEMSINNYVPEKEYFFNVMKKLNHFDPAFRLYELFLSYEFEIQDEFFISILRKNKGDIEKVKTILSIIISKKISIDAYTLSEIIKKFSDLDSALEYAYYPLINQVTKVSGRIYNQLLLVSNDYKKKDDIIFLMKKKLGKLPSRIFYNALVSITNSPKERLEIFNEVFNESPLFEFELDTARAFVKSSLSFDEKVKYYFYFKTTNPKSEENNSIIDLLTNSLENYGEWKSFLQNCIDNQITIHPRIIKKAIRHCTNDFDLLILINFLEAKAKMLNSDISKLLIIKFNDFQKAKSFYLSSSYRSRSLSRKELNHFLEIASTTKDIEFIISEFNKNKVVLTATSFHLLGNNNCLRTHNYWELYIKYVKGKVQIEIGVVYSILEKLNTYKGIEALFYEMINELNISVDNRFFQNWIGKMTNIRKTLSVQKELVDILNKMSRIGVKPNKKVLKLLIDMIGDVNLLVRISELVSNPKESIDSSVLNRILNKKYLNLDEKKRIYDSYVTKGVIPNKRTLALIKINS